MKEKRPFVLRRCAVKASLLLLLAASSTVVFAQPGGDPPGVALNDITLVYRDWTGNLSATNRTWFYLDENGDEETTGYGIYPAIELDFLDENRAGWPVVPGVVYKSSTGLAHIQIKFQNTNEFAVTGSFEVIGIRMRVPTNDTSEPWEYIDLLCNTESASVSMAANGGIQVLSFELADFPGFVSLGQFEINYDLDLTDGEMEYENGTHGSYVGWEWMYLVDGTPTGLQAVPWTGFLNYTCRWGYGSSGEDETRQMVTYGMHYSNRSPDHELKYNYLFSIRIVEYVSGEGEDTVSSLSITQFCDEMDASSLVTMQCFDFASVLLAAHQSLGYDGSVPYTFDTAEYNFTTNELRAAHTSNWDNFDFSYHAMVDTSTNLGIEDLFRYDSSSSYRKDYLGATHEDPAAKWPMPYYWQNWQWPSVYGLVYGYVGYGKTQVAHTCWDWSPATIR